MEAGRHLVSLGELSDDRLHNLLSLAEQYAQGHRGGLEGKQLVSAFFEPSTRTRLSFESAAQRLGMQTLGFADGATSSASKGETLEDTMRVLSGYGDVVVLRHPETGAAKKAAEVSNVPVINAGDGAGEHPTQTLVDLFTMQQSLGALAGKTVAVVGDLANGRTVHSLVPALARLGANVVQVPAGNLALPPNLDRPMVALDEAAATCDVLYMTRIQRERMDQAAPENIPRVTKALLEGTGSKAIVMHPLPRVDEIAPDVDALASAKYFDQARNGVPVRMAVLHNLLVNHD